MVKFLKRAFNSVYGNLIIAFIIIAIVRPIFTNFARSGGLSDITQEKVALTITMITFFFFVNIVMLGINEDDYQFYFTRITFWSILFFVVILTAVIYGLKFSNLEESSFSYVSFGAFAYIAWVWSVYLNFCIRVLSSINVECSVFIAITVKAILIAIVAWLALYKNSGTDKNHIISFTISYISLCYPLLDMYKYVRLELDKYMKDNNNPIQINSHSD